MTSLSNPRPQGGLHRVRTLDREFPRCQSAPKFGSDSHLMQFGIRVALPMGRGSAMRQALRRSSLVPAGFVVESAFYGKPPAAAALRQ
jgi:hypothetical protein